MTVKIDLLTLRKQKAMSQDALGKALGVNQSYIGNIESGLRLPSLPMAIKIADFFGVPLDTLVVAEDGAGADQQPEAEADRA